MPDRLRWAGRVERAREENNAYRVLLGIPEERDYLEDGGVDGRAILKWILKQYDGRDVSD